MLAKLLGFVLVVGTLSACGSEGSHKPVGDNGGQSGANQPGTPTLSFAQDILPVVQNRCSLCHSAGSGLPFWEDYDVIVAKKDRVRHRVFVSQDMPRGNATGMTLEERDLVATWIDQGALP
ncbi:MAG: hypothetical protein H6624_12515 [Bdellovibrionaceae bacterium]|nr:hypothetical protein [Bdellovibrionales bacterium]MCB9085167.1 hypothetical protein [Pseudobdellovibrionaceae bacterium]